MSRPRIKWKGYVGSVIWKWTGNHTECTFVMKDVKHLRVVQGNGVSKWGGGVRCKPLPFLILYIKLKRDMG
jgi:hypothetical protein